MFSECLSSAQEFTVDDIERKFIYLFMDGD